MNSRLLSGALAAVAAVALAVTALTGGATYSAPTVSTDIGPNAVRAGAVHLDLSNSDGAGTGLAFDGLLPGQRRTRLFWVVDNDRASSVPAGLSVTFTGLHDEPGPCAVSLDKVAGERASGVSGCSVIDGQPTGTPEHGNLSWLLLFEVAWAPETQDCTGNTIENSLITAPTPGDLHQFDSPGDHPLVFRGGDGSPTVLAPGRGVCVAVTASWPPDTTPAASASPHHPVDNAAQGDSMTVVVRFDLTQASAS